MRKPKKNITPHSYIDEFRDRHWVEFRDRHWVEFRDKHCVEFRVKARVV